LEHISRFFGHFRKRRSKYSIEQIKKVRLKVYSTESYPNRVLILTSQTTYLYKTHDFVFLYIFHQNYVVNYDNTKQYPATYLLSLFSLDQYILKLFHLLKIYLEGKNLHDIRQALPLVYC